MRQKTSKWFEVKVAYDKTTESGEQKRVTELYVVEAMSFTEAEAGITKHVNEITDGDFDVKAITIPQYKEVWFSDDTFDDKYYKVKLQFITIDERTEKEKKSNVFISYWPRTLIPSSVTSRTRWGSL
jgi:hypothetical protein